MWNRDLLFIRVGDSYNLQFKSDASYRWGNQSGLRSSIIFSPQDRFTENVIYLAFHAKALLEEEMTELQGHVGFKIDIK